MSDNSKKFETNFDVSSGLKSVLGRELIINEEVAIFELVKNSFDAEASKVDIYFDADKIVIADNGDGMTMHDLKTKWLRVAYSAKRKQNDFRDEASKSKAYAGSKGIGRLSTDRLGEIVTLQTRAWSNTDGNVLGLEVDWSKFDVDHQDRFEDIPVNFLPEASKFELPKSIKQLSKGTVVSIRNLQGKWDRDKLLELKAGLSKLINPFGAETDGFKIVMHVPSEIAEDEEVRRHAKIEGESVDPVKIVNGSVGNFIFQTLEDKTTFLRLKLFDPEPDDKGNGFIVSELHDRGELIYRIREPNPYKELIGADFVAQVFFLNRAAKVAFTKSMGVRSVNFGSIFLFRNGFRVFPIGEPTDDWFQMERRKSLGYARYLGARDLIGRIDVNGDEEDFKEASSRNTGLIDTPAVKDLKAAFLENILKRLEAYIVPVTFIDKEDKNVTDISRLQTDLGRERVTTAVSKLVNQTDVELLDYSRELVQLLDERSSKFEDSLKGLRTIAERTRDSALFANIEDAETKFRQLKDSEERAKKQAEEEAQARIEAEQRADVAESRAEEVEEELEEEKKRTLFHASRSTLDFDTIQNLHHQIHIYTVDLKQRLDNFNIKFPKGKSINRDDMLEYLERISLLNSKVMGTAKFATRANFRLDSEFINADIVEYTEDYLKGIAEDVFFGKIEVVVKSTGVSLIKKFKPIDISIVIDNLIANAKKAHASRIVFQFIEVDKSVVRLRVSDNGPGISEKIKDKGRIFEQGFTTTDGSGLGLYHVRHVLGEMKATIEVVEPEDDVNTGLNYLIRISK